LDGADFEEKEGCEDGHGYGCTGIGAGFSSFFPCIEKRRVWLLLGISWDGGLDIILNQDGAGFFGDY
jgi:hypothetical protein